LVKQWPLVLADMDFFFHGKPAIWYTLVAIVTTISVIRLTNTPVEERNVRGLTKRHAVSLVYSLVAVLAVLTIILTKLANGQFDCTRFFTNNYLGGEVGELKLLDPDSLQVTAAITLPERCSFARMALTTSELGSIDTIIVLGDEHVHQVSWSSQRRELKNVPAWSKRYRTAGDG
jgi:hypothetical protein